MAMDPRTRLKDRCQASLDKVKRGEPLTIDDESNLELVRSVLRIFTPCLTDQELAEKAKLL